MLRSSSSFMRCSSSFMTVISTPRTRGLRELPGTGHGLCSSGVAAAGGGGLGLDGMGPLGTRTDHHADCRRLALWQIRGMLQSVFHARSPAANGLLHVLYRPLCDKLRGARHHAAHLLLVAQPAGDATSW